MKCSQLKASEQTATRLISNRSSNQTRSVLSVEFFISYARVLVSAFVVPLISIKTTKLKNDVMQRCECYLREIFYQFSEP